MPLVLLVLAALVLGGLLAWLLRPRPAPPAPRPSVRVEECDACGEPVAMDVAHVLSDMQDDPDTGGGTAVVATFCADHCPGGCRLGCCAHDFVTVTAHADGTYTTECSHCGLARPADPEFVARLPKDHFA